MKNYISVIFALIATSLLLQSSVVFSKVKNGFDLTDASLPVNEIRKGGPPRDGIPALNYPSFVSPPEAHYVKPQDRILGVVIRGKPRAYPIKVLNWHEVVNDVIGSQHFAVTYCPLCGTGMVFATNISDGERNTALVFGVSGLLYNSDVLLYDRQTQSLWSQIMKQSVSGTLKGTQLTQLPGLHTTWRDWLARYPDTEVLAVDAKSEQNYEKNPYEGYDRTKRLMFAVNNKSSLDIHPKESVLGLVAGNESIAFTFTALQERNQQQFEVVVGGKKFTVHWNAADESAHVLDNQGNDYPTTTAFWFAWYAFYPATQVYQNSK